MEAHGSWPYGKESKPLTTGVSVVDASFARLAVDTGAPCNPKDKEQMGSFMCMIWDMVDVLVDGMRRGWLGDWVGGLIDTMLP